MVTDAQIRKLEKQATALFSHSHELRGMIKVVDGDTEAEREARQQEIFDDLQNQYPNANIHDVLFIHVRDASEVV